MQPVLENAIQGELGDVKKCLTEVEVPNGKIGMALINAQAVTGDVAINLPKSMHCILKSKDRLAIVLVSGDSAYMFLP